jgi:N-acetylglutamate synthase-like GNAT family acetyltransferase
MSKKIFIREPQTSKEFEAYYLLRYEVLRKPWDQPSGSEKDDQEENSLHAMAVDEDGKIYGVCRLQYNSEKEAQLRFMAVAPDSQGLGIGKQLVKYMEDKAASANAGVMILQARENAVPFYKSCGYSIKETSFLLWGKIQHYLMSKDL